MKKSKWKIVIDFTRIKKGGVDINDIISRLQFCIFPKERRKENIYKQRS